MIFYVAAGLLALLSLSIPVGIVLFLLGFGVDIFFSPFPLIRGLGQMVWSTSNNATLIAIPFFVLLGEVLVRSGVAEKTIPHSIAGYPGCRAGLSMPMSQRPPCSPPHQAHRLPRQQQLPPWPCPRPNVGI